MHFNFQNTKQKKKKFDNTYFPAGLNRWGGPRGGGPLGHLLDPLGVPRALSTVTLKWKF